MYESLEEFFFTSLGSIDALHELCKTFTTVHDAFLKDWLCLSLVLFAWELTGLEVVVDNVD